MMMQESQSARIFPGHPPDIPRDFEARVMDFARETLRDIPCCLMADYDVRWMAEPGGGRRLPVLVICFPALVSGSAEHLAIGIGLVKARTGTLLDAYPGHETFHFVKLRDHILRSVDAYLTKVGIPVGLQVTA